MDDNDFTLNGSSVPAAGEGLPAGRPVTILLAEDDPQIRELVTILLQGAGYAVIPAEDGEGAVHTFAERGDEVDVLLFDLIMPEKNGWQAYCEISRVRPGIPHLFMSGYMGDVIPREELAKGLDAIVVRKPFMHTVLLSKLRDLLR